MGVVMANVAAVVPATLAFGGAAGHTVNGEGVRRHQRQGRGDEDKFQVIDNLRHATLR